MPTRGPSSVQAKAMSAGLGACVHTVKGRQTLVKSSFFKLPASMGGSWSTDIKTEDPYDQDQNS